MGLKPTARFEVDGQPAPILAERLSALIVTDEAGTESDTLRLSLTDEHLAEEGVPNGDAS